MNYCLHFAGKDGSHQSKVDDQFSLLQGKERTEWRKCKLKAQPVNPDCPGKTFLCDVPYLSAPSLRVKHKNYGFFKCLNYISFYLSVEVQSLLAITLYSQLADSCQNPPPRGEVFQLLLLKPVSYKAAVASKGDASVLYFVFVEPTERAELQITVWETSQLPMK